MRVVFFGGGGNRKKYLMERWEALARHKDFGGLGFIDTKAMNIALFTKWIYKLDSGMDNIATRVLHKII